MDELQAKLKNEGIIVNYKCRGNTNVVQGISFTKNDLKFNGSKIDRQFSYSKIKYRLDQNRKQEYVAVIDNPSLDQAFCRLVKEVCYKQKRMKKEQRKREPNQRLKPIKKKNRGRGHRM